MIFNGKRESELPEANSIEFLLCRNLFNCFISHLDPSALHLQPDGTWWLMEFGRERSKRSKSPTSSNDENMPGWSNIIRVVMDNGETARWLTKEPRSPNFPLSYLWQGKPIVSLKVGRFHRSWFEWYQLTWSDSLKGWTFLPLISGTSKSKLPEPFCQFKQGLKVGIRREIS